MKSALLSMLEILREKAYTLMYVTAVPMVAMLLIFNKQLYNNKLPCMKLRVSSTMKVHNLYMFEWPAANHSS